MSHLLPNMTIIFKKREKHTLLSRFISAKVLLQLHERAILLQTQYIRNKNNNSWLTFAKITLRAQIRRFLMLGKVIVDVSNLNDLPQCPHELLSQWSALPMVNAANA